VEAAALLDELCALATSAGIEVRRLPRARDAEGEPAPRSGACVLQGRRLVLLAPGDPVEDRIEVLAQTLAALDPAWLEARWLAPAVRERLDRAAARPGGG